jgi:urease accessory protein
VSELRLKTENHGGKTVVTDCRFTAPLKVAKPFYHASYTEVMVMQASAGLLAGDTYDMAITASSGARCAVTGQSYTKVFRADGETGASSRVRLDVGDGATLVWLSSPVIPFGGSRYDARTDVYLHEGARFFLCDILACGRVGMGERFAFTSYRAKTAVHVGEKLVFLDNTRLLPSKYDVSATGFFEGRTHMALLYLYGCGDFALPASESVEAAASCAAQGVCVRALGDSAQALSEFARGCAAALF